MSCESPPPSKRVKYKSESELAQYLQEINVGIQQASEFVTTLQRHVHIDIQSPPSFVPAGETTEALAKHVGSEVKRLNEQLQAVLNHIEDSPLKLRVPNKSYDINISIHSIHVLLIDLLPAKSFRFLASTSKNMLKVLSPLINRVSINFKRKNGVEFRYFQPQKLVKVAALPVPSCVTNIRFHKSYNQPIYNLPITVTKITFNNQFNQQVDNLLPTLVTHLDFGHDFNCPVDHLPPRITHLSFGSSFNLPVDLLPASVTHLTFGIRFSHPVDNLPRYLQSLHILNSFKHSLDNLPDTIRTLYSGYDNTHPIKRLPSSLIHLTLPTNVKLMCPLPHALTHLYIAYNDSPPNISSLPLTSLVVLPGAHARHNFAILPTTLKTLSVGNHWNETLDSLPASLTVLTINSLEFQHPLNHLPNSITHLTLDQELPFMHTLSNLPPSITHLEILSDRTQPLDLSASSQIKHLTLGDLFNSTINNLPPSIIQINLSASFNQPVDQLPPNLTRLEFDASPLFNQPIDHLPGSLTYLTLSDEFDYSVDHLPPKITHLKFGKDFNQRVNNLPFSILHLTFGDKFNQPVNNLPYNITHLTLGNDFNQSVANLPHKIICLHFGSYFNQPVQLLPPSIVDLEFGYQFNQPVTHLPPSVTRLRFGVLFDHPLLHLPSSVTNLTLCTFFYGTHENKTLAKVTNPVLYFPTSLRQLDIIIICDKAADNTSELSPDTFTMVNLTFYLWQHKIKFFRL